MDKENLTIEGLILSGALEVEGLDSNTGEPLYRFTPKLKEVSKELFDSVSNMFNEHIMELWTQGMIDIDLMSDNPMVKLNDRSFDEESMSNLDKDLLYTLSEIKRTILS